MEMVMPNTYSVLENEEMMYLDGGGIPRWTVSVTIDTLLLYTPVGIGLAPLKYLGKQAATALVKKMAPNIGSIAGGIFRLVLGGSINMSTSTMINLIINNAASFTSIGGILAFLFDYSDGNLNGWIR